MERLGTSQVWLSIRWMAHCKNKQAIRMPHKEYTKPSWSFMDHKCRLFTSRGLFICAGWVPVNNLVFLKMDCPNTKPRVKQFTSRATTSNLPVNV